MTKQKQITAMSILLISAGLICNEWMLALLFSEDGVLGPRTRIKLWIFQGALILSGLSLIHPISSIPSLLGKRLPVFWALLPIYLIMGILFPYIIFKPDFSDLMYFMLLFLACCGVGSLISKLAFGEIVDPLTAFPISAALGFLGLLLFQPVFYFLHFQSYLVPVWLVIGFLCVFWNRKSIAEGYSARVTVALILVLLFSFSPFCIDILERIITRGSGNHYIGWAESQPVWVSYVHAVSQSFPPKNPFFFPNRLEYHYGVSAMGSIISDFTGFPPHVSLFLFMLIVVFMGTAAMIVLIARKYFDCLSLRFCFIFLSTHLSALPIFLYLSRLQPDFWPLSEFFNRYALFRFADRLSGLNLGYNPNFPSNVSELIILVFFIFILFKHFGEADRRETLTGYILVGLILGLLAYCKMTAALPVFAGVGCLCLFEWFRHRRYEYFSTLAAMMIVFLFFHFLLSIHSDDFVLRPEFAFLKLINLFRGYDSTIFKRTGGFVVSFFVFLIIIYHARLPFTIIQLKSFSANDHDNGWFTTAFMSLSMFVAAFIMANIFYIRTMEIVPKDVALIIDNKNVIWGDMLYPAGIGFAVCGSFGITKWLEKHSYMKYAVIVLGAFFLLQLNMHKLDNFIFTSFYLGAENRKETQKIVDGLVKIPVDGSLILTNVNHGNLSAVFGHHFFFTFPRNNIHAQSPEDFEKRYRLKRDLFQSSNPVFQAHLLEETDITHVFIVKYWWKKGKKAIVYKNSKNVAELEGWQTVFENFRCRVLKRMNG